MTGIARALLAPFASLLFAHAVHAVVIVDFSTETNDRFANDPDFIGSAFDWSGVGRSSAGQWATLVALDVFLSANHYHPEVGSSVTFYNSNDPAGASTTVTVTGGQRLGSSDLWIGLLATPLTSTYTSYDYQTETISSFAEFASSSIAGRRAKITGHSDTTWSTTQDLAVGENYLESWISNNEVAGTTDHALVSLYNTPGGLTYEALLEPGDSGAPLFLTSGDTLYLTGINWWTGSVATSTTTYQASGFSYVGNYATDIAAYISANSLSAVPEPTNFALLSGLVGLAFAYSRRRHQHR
ncbi:hypothetical protein [Actomonas aquatica]|uniref:PEP-CTERM protein-sorting domain-containing protein n=1 Tax=Actomonas aquatica TaxID=2866162 RepID=A0ABZ1C8A1_9BACT|nr:hypothetical protein [Opitutus sp. WL0086]WRQ87503.1 hypothetical protein K1X11_022030 [Opitutus sp. WL0086]